MPIASPERTAPPRALGARVLRREDARFLRGAGRYVSDVTLPGLLHAAFVRSPTAHARVVSVDVSGALELPGVVAAVTAVDLEGLASPMRAASRTPGYRPCDTPVLARDKVRMVGDPIALIIAERSLPRRRRRRCREARARPIGAAAVDR